MNDIDQKLNNLASMINKSLVRESSFAEKPPIFADFAYQGPDNMRNYPSHIGTEDPVPQISYETDPLGYVPVPHSGGMHGSPIYNKDSWYGWYAIELSHVRANLGEPIGVMIRNQNCPYPFGNDVERRGSPESFQYIIDNIARLDYVLMDLEGSDREIVELNIRKIHEMVRNHPDERINQARIGNYGYHMSETDEGFIWPGRRSLRNRWEDHDPVKLYEDCLDVSMPIAYPYQTASAHCSTYIQGDNVAPNPKAAIFWQSLERFSAAARALPEGHMLMPWVGKYIYHPGGGGDAYNAPHPTEQDNKALIMHMRLRKADCFYTFTQSFQKDYKETAMEAWKLLDAVWAIPLEREFLNLNTNKKSGVQWSGVKLGKKHTILLVSNMAENTTQIGTNHIGPGEHKLIINGRLQDVPS